MNSNSKNKDIFWPSFTDLMTSLFFIMLLLYILTFLKLTNQKHVTEQQLNRIKEIQNSVTELPREYFTYDAEYKRFSLVKNIEFETQKAIISWEDTKYLIEVGKAIQDLIETLKRKYSNQEIKYIILIEGMASKDSNSNFKNNYPLSYKRAWAVQKLWKRNNVLPDPSVCEVQIAGSGTGGIGRFSTLQEIKNQRILIQIVPKIGEIKIQ